MRKYTVFIFSACLIHSSSVFGLWSCSSVTDCDTLVGSVCSEGQCACAPGQEPVLGGTRCADLAAYHTSPCVEDHQCSRLVSTYECRRNGNDDEGSCYCQPGHHYFLGRCWPSATFGEACTRDEQCFGVIRDPYSLQCRDNRCTCAEGYYSRQGEECRRAGLAVGAGCVISEDCQFEGGACDITTFTCYNINDGPPTYQSAASIPASQNVSSTRDGNHHGAPCNMLLPCQSPFVCTSQGVCVCPVGYYANDDMNSCLAELGSPSTPEQCAGLLAEVSDGICTCPTNFFFEENMRDCTKVTRRITDSCVSDANCFTFGAASRCGEPHEDLYLRVCECIPELAVWDAGREMCRLFAGVGGECEVDSDCLAGELEIQCVADASGQGYCTCPEGYITDGGLCLTTGLALGDYCQATTECTETENTICSDGRCSCGDGYQENDGVCAPTIGGMCTIDTDCVIENTVCVSETGISTCQCGSDFLLHNDNCWPVVSGHLSVCNITEQCEAALGASTCVDNVCVCAESYHFRDNGCWPRINLFEACSRTSECYLSELSDRVVCRNSLCQCDFQYRYSEDEHTCNSISSATSLIGKMAIVLTSLLYLYCF